MPEHNKIAPANDVVYNVLVDMPNAIPAAFNKVGGSATYSDDAYGTEQEWDMSDASAATHTTIVEQPGVPEAPADAQPPPVRTCSGRQVQRRDFYSPQMFTAAKNIKQAFDTEDAAAEADKLQQGREKITTRIKFQKGKKRFTPRNGWTQVDQRRRFHKMQKAKKAVTRAAKEAREIKEVDMSPIEVDDELVFGNILMQLSLKQEIKEWGQENITEY